MEMTYEQFADRCEQAAHNFAINTYGKFWNSTGVTTNANSGLIRLVLTFGKMAGYHDIAVVIHKSAEYTEQGIEDFIQGLRNALPTKEEMAQKFLDDTIARMKCDERYDVWVSLFEMHPPQDYKLELKLCDGTHYDVATLTMIKFDPSVIGGRSVFIGYDDKGEGRIIEDREVEAWKMVQFTLEDMLK